MNLNAHDLPFCSLVLYSDISDQIMKREYDRAFLNQRIERYHKSRVPLLIGHNRQKKIDNLAIYQNLGEEVGRQIVGPV